jgi:GT2 family glycosyltransferase
MNPIRISLLVPAYNRPQELQECLSALIASSGPDAEIIVVDDASTDDALLSLPTWVYGRFDWRRTQAPPRLGTSEPLMPS